MNLGRKEMINWKRCRRCEKMFDIGINFQMCPECRIEVKRKRIEKEELERENDGTAKIN